MNKKNLQRLSLYTFIIAIVVFAINYYFFHFVTDEGLGFVFHEEAQKPFVADLIGQLGVLLVFSSIISLLASFIFYNEKK